MGFLYAFLHPRTLYDVETYANTCKSFTKGLIVLSNKILRILQHQSYRAHAAELYINYDTLDIPGLHNYQLCLLADKFLFCNKMSCRLGWFVGWGELTVLVVAVDQLTKSAPTGTGSGRRKRR